jgi:hypothetical protein
MKPIRTEDDLMDLRQGAQALAAAAAWARAGHFRALADGEPRALAELPGDPRALRVTARILAHMGLLVGDGARVALAPVARAMLAAGELEIAGVLGILGDFSRLAAVLADGGPVRDEQGNSRLTRGGVREDDVPGTRAFLGQLHRRSAESAEQCARWIAHRVPRGGHVLDLGGGHGRYARALVESGLAATVYDRPVCVDLARELNGDALSYLTGDFMTDPLGGPYHAVLLSNILHGQSDAENAALFARIAAVLVPGGHLIAKDMFLDEFGSQPHTAALFGMTMLLYTAGGESYGLREVGAWARAAGLSAPEVVNLETYALVFCRTAG